MKVMANKPNNLDFKLFVLAWHQQTVALLTILMYIEAQRQLYFKVNKTFEQV